MLRVASMIVGQQYDEGLVQALFEDLVNRGFRGCCCGRKDDPNAVVAYYEWPHHVDVVTVLQKGPPAAARSVKPANVLDPPNTAVWAWVSEEPEAVIRALLRLAHPEHSDAPAG